MAGHINFTRLVLWAGIFPPDMNFDTGKNLLQQKEVIVAYGKQDEFLNDARFLEMNQIIQKLSVEVKSLPFEGGHEIDQETLLKIIEPRG
jgi:predicted esterase